jgi:hypothetical protein
LRGEGWGGGEKTPPSVNINFTKLEDSISELYNYYVANKNLIDKNLLLTDK